MKKFMKIVSAALLCGVMTLSMTGCKEQDTVAALIQIVGNSVSSLVLQQGKTDLASTLSTDFTAASGAVANWQEGTASQNVVQALQLLTKDLNLIPLSDQNKVYVTLAIATTESILAVVKPAASGSMSVARAKSTTVITSKEYKKQWNALVDAHAGNASKI